jgi:hypothetical protein
MNIDLRKENIELLKNDYVDFIKTTIQETGSLYPSFTVFSEIKGEYEEDKPKIGLIHIPVPSKFMEDADSKDELVTDVLPEISKTIKKDFVPYALAWASEVWVRRINKEDVKSPKDLEKLSRSAEKVEAIFINIESEFENNVYVYEIEKDGKQINADGDLVDKINLIEAKDLTESVKEGSMSGRFSNLFHLFK